MSYKNGLLLHNILNQEEAKKLVDFCEGRKLTIYRHENIRGCSFYDSNLAKKIESRLKSRGNWDEDAIQLTHEMMLYNYWDLLPPFSKSTLARKTYTKTRTFLDTTGRDVQIMLDIGTNEKYILSTRFIHRKRIIEAPTTNKVFLSTTQQWKILV